MHILAFKASVQLEEPFEIPEWQLKGYKRGLKEIIEKMYHGKVTIDLQYKSPKDE